MVSMVLISPSNGIQSKPEEDSNKQNIQFAITQDEISQEDLYKLYTLYGGMYLYGTKIDFEGIDSREEFQLTMFSLSRAIDYPIGKYKNISDYNANIMTGPLNSDISFEDFKEVVKDHFYNMKVTVGENIRE